jgi:hypothetical protein
LGVSSLDSGRLSGRPSFWHMVWEIALPQNE